MKKVLFFAAMALVAASCSTDEMIGVTGPQDNSPSGESNAIVFASAAQGVTRAGELTGATAAEKLGGMFVVEGTKGDEQDDSPSKDVVFDNYLVGYDYNSAGKTESNTNNWEYVGKQTGITDHMTAATWSSLHSGATDAKVQSIKYWDYSTTQYDFIAWSTGNCVAVPVPDPAAEPDGGTIQVSRINTGSGLATQGFTMRAASATDLLQCYYTDITTVKKANSEYGQPVTLTFKNMAAKVRVALYETVPGYSVKDVKFYNAESDNVETVGTYDPTDLGTASSATNAVLFTTGSDVLPQSGIVKVYYPRIGKNNRDDDPRPVDYNKASVTVTSGDATSTTQKFGSLTANYTGKESESTYEKDENVYLGRTLPTATFAGSSADNYYKAVIPNTNGKPLTLRVDYTLVSTDGSTEVINVYGAKAVVPATYTVWQPNYAYTYVFKISDNTNGWTSQTVTDPKGLFPITFDAVVTSFKDANAEQTTVTTVATPSITTYQQGHTKDNNEYSKSQLAGADEDNVKKLYVQVMDNSGATPTLVTNLNTAGKSLLFAVTTTGTTISEATVMDALQNRTNTYDAASPVGRNGITLTTDAHIANDVDEIVNGVDDQPIDINAGEAAEIDIASLSTDPTSIYAYVYVKTAPTADEKIYNVVSTAEAQAHPTLYYPVTLIGDGTDAVMPASSKALADKVYFIKNYKADGITFDSYTFKQTKVNDDVAGLVEAAIPAEKAGSYAAGKFYFDVYNQNKGEYAVKIIKIVP